jgi:hypothetical protein
LAGVRWQAVAFAALETIGAGVEAGFGAGVAGAGTGLMRAAGTGAQGDAAALTDLPMLEDGPVLADLMVPEGAAGARLAVLAAWHRMVPLARFEAVSAAPTRAAEADLPKMPLIMVDLGLQAVPALVRADGAAGLDLPEDFDAPEAFAAAFAGAEDADGVGDADGIEEADGTLLSAAPVALLAQASLPPLLGTVVRPEIGSTFDGASLRAVLDDGASAGAGMAATGRDGVGLPGLADARLQALPRATAATAAAGTGLADGEGLGPDAIASAAQVAVRAVAAAISGRLVGAEGGEQTGFDAGQADGSGRQPVPVPAGQVLAALPGRALEVLERDVSAAVRAAMALPPLAAGPGRDAAPVARDLPPLAEGAGDIDVAQAGVVDAGQGGEVLQASTPTPLLGRERAVVVANGVAGGQALGAGFEAASASSDGGHVLATALGPVRIVVEGEAAALRVTLTAAETAVAAFDGARAALAAALQAQGMRLETLAVRVEAALLAGGDVSADGGGREGASAETREFSGGQEFGRNGGSAGERAALARAAAGFGVASGSDAAVLAVDAGLAQGRPAERFA